MNDETRELYIVTAFALDFCTHKLEEIGKTLTPEDRHFNDVLRNLATYTDLMTQIMLQKVRTGDAETGEATR